MKTVDVAIAGGGPTGLALAGMLALRGMPADRVVVIDGKTTDDACRDPRSIALSWGSRELLTQIQAWPVRATAITQIHVSRRGSFGRTLIDCDDHQLPALGYVCQYGDLIRTLCSAMDRLGVMQHRPTRLITTDEQESRVMLRLSDDTQISTGLLVQAEGGVFGEQSRKTIQRDYRQMAIVARVHSSRPVAGRAFERFTEEGPLALLPDDDAYSLVWCVRPARSDILLALPDDAFLQALQRAFGDRVGRFTAISQRSSYPLGLNAQPTHTTRSIAIGNAAQTLHPVAGQGLNLGLRDAAVLAAGIAQRPTPESIRSFSQRQRGDRGLTVRLTDVMARVFATSEDQSLLQGLLGLSLGAIDLLAPARHALSEQMMFGWRQ